MMVSLKSFALQHPKTVAAITLLAITLIADPATAVSPVVGVILM